MPSKPAQRTMDHLRKEGYIVGVVEKFNAHMGEFGQRVDLFGFADLIAFKPTEPVVVLIQCSAGGDHADHKAKILENDIAPSWVRMRERELWLVSWSSKVPREPKLKKNGEPVLRKGQPVMSFKKYKNGKRMPAQWTIRIEEFTPENWEEDPF